MKAVKSLKTFRWNKKTLKELRAEAKRTARPQIKILETAFGYYMALKADGRDGVLAATTNGK